MSNVLTYYRTAEYPDILLWLQDDDGNLIDFSSGWTFTFKLGSRGSTATFTKTSNITGAAGSGVEPSGTPNVSLLFVAAELDAVAAGPYTWQLRATNGTRDRVFQGRFTLIDVIT